MPTPEPDQGSVDIVVTCSACGEELAHCETIDPRTNDEPALCDDCSREFSEFDCCWCDDSDANEYQHILLVVFDPEAVDVALPGVYRLTETPSYAQPLPGHALLWEESLTWLGYLPACHGDGYACGHLCRRFQAKALAEVLYDTRCGVAAHA
jgi:hypothetical protein